MSNYPDWVNEYKERGTTIKKVGNEYYLYKSTSKRVAGMKYPQPVQEYIGVITKEGVVRTNVRKISTDTVKVYEYGMSYALKELLPDKFLVNSHDKETLWYAFLHIVKMESPESYLLRNVNLPDPEELHIAVSMQKQRYERLTGISIESLRSLSKMYLVETKECDMLTEVTLEMREIFKEVGITIDGV